MTPPLLADLGPWEIIIILGVLLLLFGAKKLPELARGSGQALRIFKAETKDLRGAGDEREKSEAQQEIDATTATQREAEVKAEQERQTDTPS